MPKHNRKTKRQLVDDKGEGDSKKAVQLESNKTYGDLDYQAKLKDKWKSDDVYSDEHVSFSKAPFPHGELSNFLDPEFLENFVGHFDKFEFHEKASDLFQFRQSDDLKSFTDVDPDPFVLKLMEYLTEQAQPMLKNITDLPLNSNIDLFLSDYRKNDFLLCHDDELDSRRIAFILYLSQNWKPEFGGNLDLFSCTEKIHPDKVVKSLTPEFNKFVFFEVSAKSFHQVSEIVQGGVKRLALSGWFYGESVPRPKIEFTADEGYPYLDSTKDLDGIMKKFCSEGYLSQDTLQDINDQLTEESQVLIPGFLLDSVYKSICSDIVEQDVSQELFTKVGPPNVSCYYDALRGPPSEDKTIPSDEQNLNGLRNLFHSVDFLQFMEKLTELPFTTCQILKATSSLRKFGKGSYSLLRSGGAKQTGEGESCETALNNENDDVEEEPNLVDIIYFVASKWDEVWGGLTIYSAADGEQLITIPPEGNCLAVVVRSSSVNPYINYVNSDANEELFFVYTLTCAFDGNL